jgi:polyisoprenoid-binding protein YceI
MTAGTALHPDYVVGTWSLDKAHSELSFTVKHLAISKVRGFFRSFDVTITTAEDYEDSTIEASIDMSSVDTNNEMRDGHLKTNDFFLVEEHPTATFVSKSIVGTPDDFTVTGDLTLRGVTKEVSLKGEFGGINTDAQGNVHAGASATTKLNRLDFGVAWNAPLETGGVLLGDEITLTFELQVILQK